MAEVKTKVNTASVKKFLTAIKDVQKRKDCLAVSLMMERATKSKPEMWGASIVGFGRRKYKYANGKVGEWMVIGFAPRAGNIALYGLIDFTFASGKLVQGKNELLSKLGKHKLGGGCLYINKLSDVDMKTLSSMTKEAVKRKK